MKIKINICLLSFLLLISFIGYSQGNGNGPPPNPGWPGNNPNAVPIDGGISYLFIAGILYGVYEFRKKKKHY